MKRKSFIITAVSLLLPTNIFARKNRLIMDKTDSIRLLRHATLIIEINNKKLLIDPMLSEKGSLEPVQNCGNEIRFPMVDLPFNRFELIGILDSIDAIFISHLHRDHWDIAAQTLIDKSKTIFCQPSDVAAIMAEGFKNVHPIDSKIEWNGITIHRTKGQHGEGEIGKKMGQVSGFVFLLGEQSIYLAGDTIWCHDVSDALSTYKPKVTILNAGGARFLTGGPITMTPTDVAKV